MKVLFHLLSWLRPFWKEAVLSVLLGTAAIASGIGLMGTSAYLISAAALHPGIETLQVAIVGVRFLGLSRGVWRYLERLVTHSVNFRLLTELRIQYYSILEEMAPARLTGYSGGELLNRVIADVEVLENFYVRLIAPAVVAGLVTTGAVWFTGAFSPWLGMIITCGLLLSGVGLPAFLYLSGRPVGISIASMRETTSRRLVETIQGLGEWMAYGKHEERKLELFSQFHAYDRQQEKRASLLATGSALSLLFQYGTAWLVLRSSVDLVRSSQIDGVFMAVLYLVALTAFEAVQPLQQGAAFLGEALASARRLLSLMEKKPRVRLPGASAILSAGSDWALHVSGLTFTYPGEFTPVLSEVSLELIPGKRLALLGPNGSGKSTLVQLLLRLWDPPAGTIWLNGRDLLDYSPENIRQRFAVIPQRITLFSGSLAENLRLGRANASDREIEKAALDAGLEDLLRRLPGGLQGWVGAQGDQLSEGERRRVAVARALLKAGDILLMDEPTSNLDNKSARSVIQTLFGAYAGKPILWITHDLIGLEEMDEILVLREGRILERGSPAELVSAGGWYQQALLLQKRVF